VTHASPRAAAIVLTVAVASSSACHGRRFEKHPDGEGVDAAVDSSATLSADAKAPLDEALPSDATDALEPRARHLLEAIATDDPDRALDIIFPRDAWIAARDSTQPGKDWAQRVDASFRKAIHALARRHVASDARFVSLELGPSIEQETLRKHGWKKPLWTVHGSRLTFMVDGRTRVVSIREMTAWRGAWYVTRLR
jgi:hypothetical protein